MKELQEIHYGKLNFLSFLGHYKRNKTNAIEWIESLADAIILREFGINEFADEIFEEALKSHKKSVEKGKRGAEARHSKPQDEPTKAKIEPPAQHKETKPKAEKTLINNSDFNLFWDAYPKKVDKQGALKAWLRAKPDINVVLRAIETQKANWNDPQFIPMPTTWINQKRWEMQVDVIKQEHVQKSMAELFLEAGYGSRNFN